MTEELIYRLSKIRELKVIAQTSVMPYKRVAEIGRELRVGTVLEGSVRKADNKLRITVQLIDVQSEEHLWSEPYERQLEKRTTRNLGAYTLYLTGRQLWNMRLEEGLRLAIEQFQQAIEIDPDYALAYAGLADAYSIMANWGSLPEGEGYSKAREAALKALQLDDKLGEAHASLGLIKWAYEHKVREAEREFRRAIELNPNYPTAHHWYAMFLQGLGRHEEALAEVRRALDLDPLSPVINHALGKILLLTGQFEAAREQYQRTVELAPGFAQARPALAEIKRLSWDWEGAEEEIKRAIEMAPDSAWSYASYAYHLLALGRTADSLREMQRAIALSPRSIRPLIEAGSLHYFAGEYDRAIGQLQQIVKEDPEAVGAHLFLAYARRSRCEEALAELQKAEELAGGADQNLDLWTSWGRGIVYAQRGSREEAQEVLTDPKPDRASLIALLCFCLGQNDVALAEDRSAAGRATERSAIPRPGEEDGLARMSIPRGAHGLATPGRLPAVGGGDR